jgi:thiamine-phosphate pyrophosphorylase
LLLCYITDRSQFPGNEANRRRLLLGKITEAARCGINYIQVREKDLCTRDLESLANQARVALSTCAASTKLLINSRLDAAMACGADGVHLRSQDISPEEARFVYSRSNLLGPSASPTISISCHTSEEVARAAAAGATFVLFGPVFEKSDAPDVRPAGLSGLRKACQHNIPVLALGGITVENAQSCIDAGAAGIAAIRLFQANDIAEIVRQLGTAYPKS